MDEDFLRLEHITKVYDNGIMANDDVNFSARKGEIHAICGENGAGKSTLMKQIYGVEQPNEGRIIVRGSEVKLSSPQVAISHGIGMVFQHFMLVPSLTVAENVTLGIEPRAGLRFDAGRAMAMTREVCEKYGFDVDPTARIKDLTVGVKQKVEILKALVRGAEILILDEPTAVLTPQETDELFAQLRSLRESGHTIIFISHKLGEVKSLCDRLTVIRRGHTVGTYDVRGVSEADISRLMVGVDVDSRIPKAPSRPGEAVLAAKSLVLFDRDGKRVVNDVSFSVRAGEIVGIAGVEGNGQAPIVDAITGFGSSGSGSLTMLGEELCGKSVRELRDRGLAYIPEDRMALGIAANLSIKENMIADKLGLARYNKGPLLDAEAISEDTNAWIEGFSVLCDGPEQSVGMLSGGNIQKVVVARELTGKTNLIVCDQPTRGIDVGASDSIRRRLVQMRDDGSAILLVSADLSELLSLSDRLLVVFDGEVSAYFSDAGEVTEEELGYYMLGVRKMSDEEVGGAYIV
ncbi:ABC transporter ATP-binding protein [Olsenella urininfantis]|uniref:ABC transporter ATP-binding protein n=1 Tax=Olsenella urininfantis TaxID=1871033 RepID=UPI0009843D57|nr:ABC transporter ATP-binding protein [Olsenella urininfantis]